MLTPLRISVEKVPRNRAASALRRSEPNSGIRSMASSHTRRTRSIPKAQRTPSTAPAAAGISAHQKPSRTRLAPIRSWVIHGRSSFIFVYTSSNTGTM